jgi:flagellar biosynthetic protein FliQ
MTEGQLLDIARDGIWTMVLISAPVLLVGLAVGLVVSLLQAVTQLQEATLTFVPKALAMFVALIVFLPFMINTLGDFWRSVLDRMMAGG